MSFHVITQSDSKSGHMKCMGNDQYWGKVSGDMHSLDIIYIPLIEKLPISD